MSQFDDLTIWKFANLPIWKFANLEIIDIKKPLSKNLAVFYMFFIN